MAHDDFSTIGKATPGGRRVRAVPKVEPRVFPTPNPPREDGFSRRGTWEIWRTGSRRPIHLNGMWPEFVAKMFCVRGGAYRFVKKI
jgi:hypothetical protein